MRASPIVRYARTVGGLLRYVNLSGEGRTVRFMPKLIPTGRTPHELVEIPPTVLDCGHPYRPGRVTVGYNGHPVTEQRVRTYYCHDCRTTTYTSG